MKAMIITAKDVQDEEFLYPYYRLQEAGFDLEVCYVGDENKAFGKYGIPIRPSPGKKLLPAHLVNHDIDYDLIVVPGGWAPEIVRMSDSVMRIIKSAHRTGSVISAICHGPQVLISAEICKEQQMTCYEGMSHDLINAGAQYMGPGTFVSKNIVTADHYRENPQWMKQTLELVRLLKPLVVH
jgi:protease I